MEGTVRSPIHVSCLVTNATLAYKRISKLNMFPIHSFLLQTYDLCKLNSFKISHSAFATLVWDRNILWTESGVEQQNSLRNCRLGLRIGLLFIRWTALCFLGPHMPINSYVSNRLKTKKKD